MVSYGPDTQSLNYTHMYEFSDWTGDNNFYCVQKGSILDYIRNNPECSMFLEIIFRARMYEQLSNISANFTLLLPTNNFLSHIPKDFFTFMDDGMARQIVKASLLNRKIDKKLLTSSPVSYQFTQNPEMRLYITNISGKTRVNNCLDIVTFDIQANNGLIHLTNGLIVPSMDTFMN
jgi:hypothetical protein